MRGCILHYDMISENVVKMKNFTEKNDFSEKETVFLLKSKMAHLYSSYMLYKRKIKITSVLELSLLLIKNALSLRIDKIAYSFLQ